MKKSLLIVLISCNTFAQVGIGKDNPTEKLDIAGNLAISPTSNGSSSIKFYEASPNGSNKITLKAPENTPADRTVTLPSNAPVNGYALLTDAAGNTNWGAINPSSSTLASICLKGNPTIQITGGPGITTNQRFFQAFDQKITDPNNVFDLTTGTYTAKQPGNYLITAYIVPNSSPAINQTGYYYPLNLEVRKNIATANPNSGDNIMDASTIRYATPADPLVRYTVGLSGMVTLTTGDTLNLVVYLNSIGASATAGSGQSVPSAFNYAYIADYKAVFSVTAL